MSGVIVWKSAWISRLDRVAMALILDERKSVLA
jgi:hypothetical protein